MMRKRLLGDAYGDLLRAIVLLGLLLSSVMMGKKAQETSDYVFFAVLGLSLIWSVIKVGNTIRVNRRRYQDFFERFPELNGQLSAVEMGVRFKNHSLGLLTYKGHLISYRAGLFTVVPLEKVSHLNYYTVRGSWKGLSKVFLVANFLDGDRSVAIPIRMVGLKRPKLKLEAVCQEIAAEFPHITYH